MKDPCAKCPTNHNITVEPKRPIGPYNAYIPVACRDCARRALRRVAKLERLIVAGDRLNSMYDSGIREEAARIQRRAK